MEWPRDAGTCPPDETTFDYVTQRTNDTFDPTYADAGASYVQEYRFDVSKLQPLVAAPHSPDNRKTAQECSSTPIDRVYIGYACLQLLTLCMLRTPSFPAWVVQNACQHAKSVQPATCQTAAMLSQRWNPVCIHAPEGGINCRLCTMGKVIADFFIRGWRQPRLCCRSCTGGKYEDFQAAAKLMHRSGQQVKVPTFLVPATQKVWADVYGLPVAGCNGKTAAQIFEEAGCVPPASPSCAACLGGPKDTFARLNEAETVVSTTNR